MAESNSKVKTEMDSSNPNPKLKLKLLIDKKNMNVLFAEADKEFVDLLFSLMALPLGTVVNLLKNDTMPGSLGDLFRSIESLNDTYIQSSENIKSVLDPKPAPIPFKNPVLLSNSEYVNRKAYMCLTWNYNSYPNTFVYHTNISDVPNTACPDCKKPMNCELKFVDSSNSANQGAAGEGGRGFVKGVVTYMVMDNLEVKPLSTISSIALINSFNIGDLTSLEEMVVHVGPIQALKLLRVSLESKNVLTSVFLDKAAN